MHSKHPPAFLTDRCATGALRWIPVTQSPLARTATYEALKLGWWDSVLVRFPNSKRARRFIDALSIDRHFERLMAEQKAAEAKDVAAA
jgi:hypothetical protein